MFLNYRLVLLVFFLETSINGTGIIRLENNASFNVEELLSRIKEEDRATLKRKQIELAMKSLWFRPNKGGSRLGIWRNVAEHRPVTMSSHTRRGLPRHATDGNMHTYAMTHYRSNSWIAVSLGETYHIGWLSLFYLKPFAKLIRGFTVFIHDPKTGWEQCGLSRNLYFSSKSRYIIVDCSPETYGDHVLIIKKGRGALGFREIHVRAWVDSTPQDRIRREKKIKKDKR
ncbi:hypothetical protein ACHWQZ_G015875 [Mnemiopsis leidyi]